MGRTTQSRNASFSVCPVRGPQAQSGWLSGWSSIFLSRPLQSNLQVRIAAVAASGDRCGAAPGGRRPAAWAERCVAQLFASTGQSATRPRLRTAGGRWRGMENLRWVRCGSWRAGGRGALSAARPGLARAEWRPLPLVSIEQDHSEFLIPRTGHQLRNPSEQYMESDYS